MQPSWRGLGYCCCGAACLQGAHDRVEASQDVQGPLSRNHLGAQASYLNLLLTTTTRTRGAKPGVAAFVLHDLEHARGCILNRRGGLAEDRTYGCWLLPGHQSRDVTPALFQLKGQQSSLLATQNVSLRHARGRLRACARPEIKALAHGLRTDFKEAPGTGPVNL